MNTFEKIWDVLMKNLGYTIVLIIAIILFAIFSDGLLYGIITSLSAVVGTLCIVLLYKEFKKMPVSRAKPATTTTAKPAAKKKPVAKKKTGSKKKPAGK